MTDLVVHPPTLLHSSWPTLLVGNGTVYLCIRGWSGYVYVLYELFFFIDNVVRAAFLCKHVRLSRVRKVKVAHSRLPSVGFRS